MRSMERARREARRRLTGLVHGLALPLLPGKPRWGRGELAGGGERQYACIACLTRESGLAMPHGPVWSTWV
ncbi:MAG: hypothetical protein FJ224_10190 [Lentisphaerae bacterium]|nr:hypothetical protein [Lentisphaerota bacterium]